jgi:hypothetical protein
LLPNPSEKSVSALTAAASGLTEGRENGSAGAFLLSESAAFFIAHGRAFGFLRLRDGLGRGRGFRRLGRLGAAYAGDDAARVGIVGPSGKSGKTQDNQEKKRLFHCVAS